MIRCIAIDDEPLALDLIRGYAQRLPALELLGTWTNSEQALAFAQTNSVDLVFLDVEMPGLTGIEFIRALNTPEHQTQVVLTTAFPEYALEGYDLDVLDYLLKPFPFARFERAVQKYTNFVGVGLNGSVSAEETANAQSQAVDSQKRTEKSDFIYVKCDQRIVKVEFSSICLIEGMKDYIIIHTEKERIITLQLMRKMEELLPPHQFVRIHRSFIVALAKITQMDRSRVCVGDMWVPIGETYKEAFFKKSLKHRI